MCSKVSFHFCFCPINRVGFGVMCCDIGNVIITDSSYRFNNELYRTNARFGNFGYLLYLSDLEKILRYIFRNH